MIPDPILLIRLLPPSTSRPLDPLLTRSYITLKMKRAINNEAESLECKVPCDHNRLNYYKTPILTFCIIPAKCWLVWSRAFHKLCFACNHHVVVVSYKQFFLHFFLLMHPLTQIYSWQTQPYFTPSSTWRKSGTGQRYIA